MSYKKWVLASYDKNIVLKNAKLFNISLLTSILLFVRGIKEPNDIKRFLYGCDEFESPSNFIDMDKLVLRVKKAILSGERICVFGDYDADGITSTALIYSYLKKKGADVIYLLPDRKKNGYGLSNILVEKIHELGTKLIFTVDNGVSAFKEIAYAKRLGIDTVVTDHHVPPEKIPECVAVVDPYRVDCSTKFKKFAGVGVVFKSVLALEGKGGKFKKLFEEYADLVTIGTIGDSIELIGESRDIIRLGIKKISESKKESISTILKLLKYSSKKINSTSFMFGVIPRINASGRMGDASRSVKLLLEKNPVLISKIFQEINDENEQRKNIENEIIFQIKNSLENSNNNGKFEKILIACGENWHHGVLGIAASKITEKYGKPSILITKEGDIARGSCRSVPGYSIYEVISKCSKHLERFGGHTMAAGFSLKTKNLETFKNDILKTVKQDIPPLALNIDCKINPDIINFKIIKDIELLEPFGSGNKEPVFGIFLVELLQIKAIGGGKHLKLMFKNVESKFMNIKKTVFEVIYFNKSSETFLYNIGEHFDLAVTLHRNSFLKKEDVSIFVEDMKLSELDSCFVIEQKRIFEKFKLKSTLTNFEKNELLPNRNDFLLLYSYLKKSKNIVQRPDVIFYRLGEKISICKIYVILDVLKEFGILEIFWDSEEFTFNLKKINQKVDLNNSKILRELKF